MTASFTLLVLSSKDRGASSPSILYPKEESGSHCLLIFVLKPRSAGLKFGSTIYIKFLDALFEQAYEQVLNNYRSTPEQRYRQLLARYPRLFDLVSLGEIATYLNISCRQLHRFRETIAANTTDEEKSAS